MKRTDERFEELQNMLFELEEISEQWGMTPHNTIRAEELGERQVELHHKILGFFLDNAL